MPANTADTVQTAAEDAKAAAASIADAVSQLASQAEANFTEAAKRLERVVTEGVEQLRTQSGAYTDTAGERVDEAQRYLTERVREKPLMAAGAALGLGVLIGLLLAGGRTR